MEITNEVEGLSEQDAKELIEEEGFQWRIEEEAGVSRKLTTDYRFDRVNLTLDEEGEVLSARIG